MKLWSAKLLDQHHVMRVSGGFRRCSRDQRIRVSRPPWPKRLGLRWPIVTFFFLQKWVRRTVSSWTTCCGCSSQGGHREIGWRTCLFPTSIEKAKRWWNKLRRPFEGLGQKLNTEVDVLWEALIRRSGVPFDSALCEGEEAGLLHLKDCLLWWFGAVSGRLSHTSVFLQTSDEKATDFHGAWFDWESLTVLNFWQPSMLEVFADFFETRAVERW